MRKQLIGMVCVMCLWAGGQCMSSAAVEIHVAQNGSDAGAGSAEAPFATLERARDALKALKKATPGLADEGVIVNVHEGIYPLPNGIEFNADDSGSEKKAVVYRSVPPGAAHLHAGKWLKASDFSPVTDEKTISRMDPGARGKILQLNLAALGIKHSKEFPNVFNTGGGILELFCNDRRMPLSRWPNSGAVNMQKVLDHGSDAKGPARHGGKFVAAEERVSRWNVSEGVWLEGYWRVPWEVNAIRVSAIDSKTREVTFSEPIGGGIGSKYAKAPALGDGKEPWWAINLLEEIDQPGEWNIDFKTQTLYFWPSSDLAGAKVYLSDTDKPMIRFNGASNLTLQGFVIEGGLGNGVEINGGSRNTVEGCVIRNMGGSGVMIKGGNDNGVRSSDIFELGQSGILLAGGDRKSLTPCGNFAENNQLHHLGIRKKTYAAGVHLGAYGNGDAVGCRVTHNLIRDLPHAGILYSGNDNVIEYNEICRVALTSGDVGAMYTWHDWTSAGNMVRHNFVHSSPRANAFYSDDGDSGDTFFGNVVYKMIYGPFIGGGHANIVTNNLIIDSERGIHIDQRGITRGYDKDKTLLARLKSVDVNQPPWSTRFPYLARLLENHPELPTGNVIENNATVRCKIMLHSQGTKEQLQFNTIKDNVALTEEEAGFVDAGKYNFELKPDSKIFQKLPGFKPLQFGKMGLQLDAFRKVLPKREVGANPPDAAVGVFDSDTDIQRSNEKGR